TQPQVEGELSADFPVVLHEAREICFGYKSPGRTGRHIRAGRESQNEIRERIAGGRSRRPGVVEIGRGLETAIGRRRQLLCLVSTEECEAGLDGVVGNRLGDGRVEGIAVIGAEVEQQTVEQVADTEAVRVDQYGWRSGERRLRRHVVDLDGKRCVSARGDV